MFRRIVGKVNGTIDKNNARALFNLHPFELNALLELAWEQRRNDGGSLGGPDRRSLVDQVPKYFFDAITEKEAGEFVKNNRTSLQTKVRWDHLIYAYLIENTKIYEVFTRVLELLLTGESLGVTTEDAQNWLRNTEELFFNDPPNFGITNVRSHIRPDLAATRRNAYFRMFGMDLNHGKKNNEPYPFIKPKASNLDFVTTFEDFLQEVWVSLSNTSNSSGINNTDKAAIASYGRQLHDMLNDRRRNGNLAREEFFFIAMMSWFHLTVEFDSPILLSLRSDGIRDDQRLYRVAEKVQVAAHAKSYDFFQLADPMSLLLTLIEQGLFNNADDVQNIFDDAASPNSLQGTLRTVITHWSIATGRDMKIRRGLNVTIPENSYRGYTSGNIPKVKSNGQAPVAN